MASKNFYFFFNFKLFVVIIPPSPVVIFLTGCKEKVVKSLYFEDPTLLLFLLEYFPQERDRRLQLEKTVFFLNLKKFLCIIWRATVIHRNDSFNIF